MTTPLRYTITCKDGLAVITLKGSIDGKAEPVFTACLNEPAVSSSRSFVVHMAEVALANAGIRDCSLFFKALRSGGRSLRVSSLAKADRGVLQDFGALPPQEAHDSLADAVKDLAAKALKAK